MAEPKDNLTPEEVQQIEGLVSALNKNPLASEELNPMARILREKLGYTEPIQEPVPEETYEDENDEVTQADGIANDVDDGMPPFRKLEEDDDIDLDDLLNEDGPTAKPLVGENTLDDFDEPKTSEPELDEFDLSNAEPEAIDDPFADLGATPTAAEFDEEESVPMPDSLDEPDPFADFDTSTTPPAVESEDDSFGSLGEDIPAEGTPDPAIFDAFDTPAQDSTFGNDPFADMGDAPSIDSGGDPFGDLGSEVAPSVSDSFGVDPFADMDEAEAVPSTKVASTTSVADEGGFDDPFGDLGVGMDNSGMDEEMGPSPPSFDDFAPSLGDMPVSAMESAGDFGEHGGLDDDLDSLGKEAEPDEDLDAGLEDEDLAIIQRELVKYPPKLRRTIIDCIVNNRIPVRNQKELIELIKAQQTPGDIANFLGALLGEKVELTETSGKFSADGIPIIASRDAYTKDGAIRRRELIRKTFLSSAAAILLFAGVVSLYKFVYIPGMAGAQYDLGLEQLDEYRSLKDPQEKKRLLAEAENYFNKGEDIDPFNLNYLIQYCDAYSKIGQYDKAFEKCFGKVEPDFGYEIQDKEHKRAWHNRKEVPNISLSKKSTWNDAGVERAGKKPLSDLHFSLVSQDKVERKIVKAGAYIVSRLKYNTHDVDTYYALGKFHSLNRKDFMDLPPGSTKKKYKNDHLAIEYFKRVFTDAGKPDHIESTAGIARIYYNKREFGTAVKYYNDIIEKYPKNPIGHGGILSTYIEMWKRDGNPQYVLNHHRQVRNALDIEDELSLPVLTKLASFYIDLDSENVRIKYNINPEDQVSGMEIDDNVEYLLNIAYGKDGGNKFAEAFYQRARYLFKKDEDSRGIKQLELTATYDPRHYLAVLQMAEYYMKVENYTEAIALLKEADDRYNAHKEELGDRDEDETLLEGRPGRIKFDLGKIQLLEAAGINKTDNLREFPGKKIYPERSIGTLSFDEKERRNGLHQAREYFRQALEIGIDNDPKLLRECNYFMGWIDYNHGEFAQALDFWAELPEEDIYNNPTILLGKGNSFYYTKQYNAALGNYLKLRDDFELKEQSISRVEIENSDHQEIFLTLTALYNNIGAVYEKKQDTVNALKHYWKAMETARKIGNVTEIATSNKDLVFARARLDREPLLEDWLPPTLDKMKDMK